MHEGRGGDLMAIGDVRGHYDAVYTLLAGTLPVPVGDSEQPTSVPHVALYSTRGGDTNGSLQEPYVDLEMPFQVTCVSRRRDQAQWLQHYVRELLLSEVLVVPGRSLLRIVLDVPSGVDRDDEIGEREGQVFFSTDVFSVVTTPE